jgi:hypothetical protein
MRKNIPLSTHLRFIPAEIAVILSGESLKKNNFALRIFEAAFPVLADAPALCRILMSFKCGEFKKNCISTPVRLTTLRRVKEVSMPRRRMLSRTPENTFGAWFRATVKTEPGRTRSGCLFEKYVSSHFFLCGSGSVC